MKHCCFIAQPQEPKHQANPIGGNDCCYAIVTTLLIGSLFACLLVWLAKVWIESNIKGRILSDCDDKLSKMREEMVRHTFRNSPDFQQVLDAIRQIHKTLLAITQGCHNLEVELRMGNLPQGKEVDRTIAAELHSLQEMLKNNGLYIPHWILTDLEGLARKSLSIDYENHANQLNFGCIQALRKEAESNITVLNKEFQRLVGFPKEKPSDLET